MNYKPFLFVLFGIVIGFFIFLSIFTFSIHHWNIDMLRKIYAVSPANSGEPYVFCEKLTALSSPNYFDCQTKSVAGFEHIVLEFDENIFTEKAKRCLQND